ncbi:hypothetical protein ACS0TY_024608 [Phlomoides rotata]
MYKNDEKSKHLMKNIRAYNMMFSFMSMGGKIDRSINKDGAPFIFKLNGTNYHQIGSMLPQQEEHPRFSQLYIYDIENEVPNRINALSGKDKDGSKKLDQQIVEDLRESICNSTYVSTMNSPEKVFEKTWESLLDDILSRQRKSLNDPEIEKLLQMNGSSLSRFPTMPLPEDSLVSETNN